MDEFNKFENHVNLAIDNEEFDHEFLIYYASKYYQHVIIKMLKRNGIANSVAKMRCNSIIVKYLQIDWSFLDVINKSMFNIMNGLDPKKACMYFHLLTKNNDLQFFIAWFEHMMSKIIFPVTQVNHDVYIPICEYLENDYPQFVDFNKCFINSILYSRNDCYDYFKNKVNVDTINENCIEIKTYNVLNDIYCNYPQFYEKINVSATLFWFSHENEAINIIYMMGLLPKIVEMYDINDYFTTTIYNINEDPKYISCEMMDLHVINIFDALEHSQLVFHIIENLTFFYECY